MKQNVAVVILNYNDYQTTCGLIEKIKDYNIINNIVIVDNNSTNESYIKLKVYESSKIKVIKSEKNGGYAYGNNVGIKYAIEELDVEFVIISNPDVLFTESVIKKVIEVGMSDSEIGLVAPTMINSNGKNAVPAWKLPTLKDDIVISFELGKRLMGDPLLYKEDLSKDINEVDVLPGSLFGARADVLKKVDYFDEETFLYCEERILAYKLKRVGFKNILLGNETYIHDHSVTISKFVSDLKKQKILLESKNIYHRKYLNISKGKEMLFKTLIPLIKLEKVLILLLRRYIYPIWRIIFNK
ncbi:MULTISPECIES: glycosyltransferase [Bacillus cereus group]|uniref:Glycosyltransferase family 2 protein n=1 Tax=Bacillus thuringiensis TaxID=1428 RepID=A0AAW4HY15_BACTU|nr:glycosyltransferase family 2 protein [Bacillus thuringiensis]MBN9900795.1 glycosyltransferase family 2 protein [Bacillus thuringiensis]MDY7520223.1 glycosyltransferase family 2 protein [Bacillus thuringiensis]